MAKLKLTLAFDSYDYLQPLRDGRVQPEGIDLNLLTVESGIRHERFYRYGEYDACEFSMCSYITARGHGKYSGNLKRDRSVEHKRQGKRRDPTLLRGCSA
ncbi:MAG: hypothetical protein A3F90_09905 [Deltaproteobacteria bacterium RIFCSPLOWO2_12_FULL_60_19]|nr:MAG: hypothetical protein A3F90_09905 [Deltaproteobacteria bacterium RIFCSPLOWO2_12_FULL_60_19]